MPYLPFLPHNDHKLSGSALISGTPSGKSGVDMSTPVHPVVTPLDMKHTVILLRVDVKLATNSKSKGKVYASLYITFNRKNAYDDAYSQASQFAPFFRPVPQKEKMA